MMRPTLIQITPRPTTCVRGVATARLSVVLVCAVLTGCMVGPDYVRPELAQSTGYSSTALPAQTVATTSATGAAQRFAIESDIRSDWWTLFKSPALNTLIEQAFAASPTIEAAKRALKVAQENVYAQQGFFFPTVAANFTPSRTKLPGNLAANAPGVQGDGSVIAGYQGTPASEGGTAPFNGGTIFNFHTAQFTVGFVPDVFGANMRAVESMQAQANAQHYQLQAAYVTLATNIVAAAFQDALLRKQIAITREMIDDNLAAVALVQRQHKAGFASQLDLSMQQSALGQVRQLLPPLEKQFEQNRDLLKVLAGLTQDQEIVGFNLDDLALPEELPVTLPAWCSALRNPYSTAAHCGTANTRPAKPCVRLRHNTGRPCSSPSRTWPIPCTPLKRMRARSRWPKTSPGPQEASMTSPGASMPTVTSIAWP